jgi:hypothetical protein
VHVLCLPIIASVVLALGSPAPADEAAHADGISAELPSDVAVPLRAPVHSPPPPDVARLPVDGAAPLAWTSDSPTRASSLPNSAPEPLRVHVPPRPPATPVGWVPVTVAPLSRHGGVAVDPFTGEGAQSRNLRATDSRIAVPFKPGPSLTPPPPDPRKQRIVRLELLVGPVWRIKQAEAVVMVGLEYGRLHGFSGTLHGGMFVAPDRDFVGVNDFPIGGGFNYRHRFGQRSLYGSVGVTAGILVHRASTDIGIVHRVDPDFQVPLRFGWTVGPVGLSVALLQGFSVRTRSYTRRGNTVWERIPYRIGFAVGLHFDIGVGRAKPRPSAPRRRETP